MAETVVIITCVTAVALVLALAWRWRSRRGRTLDSIVRASELAADRRPVAAVAARRALCLRALTEQIAALDALIADQLGAGAAGPDAVPQDRVLSRRHAEMLLLRETAAACATALEGGADDAALPEADRLVQRIRTCVLAERSGPILDAWRQRHLAEVNRVETQASRHEAAAEVALRADLDHGRLKAGIR